MYRNIRFQSQSFQILHRHDGDDDDHVHDSSNVHRGDVHGAHDGNNTLLHGHDDVHDDARDHGNGTLPHVRDSDILPHDRVRGDDGVHDDSNIPHRDHDGDDDHAHDNDTPHGDVRSLGSL